MSGGTPDFSIIIPAYNEERRLGRTFDKIREYFTDKNTSLGNIEILVVDDGSSDGTVQLTRRWMKAMPCLRLVSNGRKSRQGLQRAARNAASPRTNRAIHGRRSLLAHWGIAQAARGYRRGQ